MKQLLLLPSLAMLSFCGFAQTQIGNSDMESWESAPAGEEPVNWNSFMTASGQYSGLGDVQIEQSTNTRPGSSGTTSARIWSRNAGFGITANGNMTLGQINMGSISASDPANHNITRFDNMGNPVPEHSEAFTDSPDSIVFWVNYLPIDSLGGTEQARMKATLHDDYEYRDPEDAGSADQVVATAELNFNYTSGWVRMAVPFDYSGPASNIAFILVTFTTNAVPGGGDPNDQVWIDDVELIYNGGGSNSIAENEAFPFQVFMNNENSTLHFESSLNEAGNFEVIDMTGAVVLSGNTAEAVQFDAPTGVYMVNVTVGTVSKRFKIYHK